MQVPQRIVGHWQDHDVADQLNVWLRASAAQDMQGARIARFGDNMRDAAVTEGDKVAAQIRFGYEVNVLSGRSGGICQCCVAVYYRLGGSTRHLTPMIGEKGRPGAGFAPGSGPD